MVLDLIPQSLPVHFFGPRPQPPTCPAQWADFHLLNCHFHVLNSGRNPVEHTHADSLFGGGGADPYVSPFCFRFHVLIALHVPRSVCVHIYACVLMWCHVENWHVHLELKTIKHWQKPSKTLSMGVCENTQTVFGISFSENHYCNDYKWRWLFWCVVFFNNVIMISKFEFGRVWCSVRQCGAGWGSVLHCAAVCCSMLQYIAVCCSVLQCAAVCCSVLQCVAVCCSVLQCAAVIMVWGGYD